MLEGLSMKTITQELLDGLKNADDIKTFLDLHEQDFLSQSLIDYLNELMNEKNITVAQVAKDVYKRQVLESPSQLTDAPNASDTALTLSLIHI